jgi:hypothetical protein
MLAENRILHRLGFLSRLAEGGSDKASPIRQNLTIRAKSRRARAAAPQWFTGWDKRWKFGVEWLRRPASAWLRQALNWYVK